jgi:hypothetical protein
LYDLFILDNVLVVSFVSKKKPKENIQNIAHEKLAKELSLCGVTNATIAQRETSKNINTELLSYFTENKIKANMSRPHQTFELQLADFASWAIYKKYTDNSSIYFEKLNTKIIE